MRRDLFCAVYRLSCVLAVPLRTCLCSLSLTLWNCHSQFCHSQFFACRSHSEAPAAPAYMLFTVTTVTTAAGSTWGRSYVVQSITNQRLVWMHEEMCVSSASSQLTLAHPTLANIAASNQRCCTSAIQQRVHVRHPAGRKERRYTVITHTFSGDHGCCMAVQETHN